MIDLEEAKKIGKKNLQKYKKIIYEIRETNEEFVVLGADKNLKFTCDNCAGSIKINKDTGRIEDFVLPDKNNFELLKESRVVYTYN